jgi:hypothetical protein
MDITMGNEGKEKCWKCMMLLELSGHQGWNRRKHPYYHGDISAISLKLPVDFDKG